MAWNVGDAPIIEAVFTPHTSNPGGVATTVNCTFTDPTGAETIVAMSNNAGTWRCTGPTIDLAGAWTYTVAATAGLIAAETGRLVAVT